ncbi:uncharacterized protein LOC128392857 [Panonychus citri]|uniref:uncharacterized protein LOC128392857 n=1 Tax=Panonychus citri TaxID=50023 RepID=UPI002306F779|nr:uncharacterized protein LOC128392857 [Panonychus citri]
MKLLLPLIALSLVSSIESIKSIPDEYFDQFLEDVTLATVQYHIDWIESIKGWKENSTLESNVIHQVQVYMKFDADDYSSKWDYDLSIKANLVNLASNVLTNDLTNVINLNQTVLENVHTLISGYVLRLPFYLGENKVLKATRFVAGLIKQLDIPDLDVNKSLKTNIDSFVTNALAGIEASTNSDNMVSSVKTIVENFVTSALKLIRFKGYSSQVNLHDNAYTFLRMIIKK